MLYTLSIDHPALWRVAGNMTSKVKEATNNAIPLPLPVPNYNVAPSQDNTVSQ
jgi:hypothetical protein